MLSADQNAGIRLGQTVGSSQSKGTQHNDSDQAVLVQADNAIHLLVR